MDAEQEKGQESPEKVEKKEKKILKKKSPFLPGNSLCFPFRHRCRVVLLLGNELLSLKCSLHVCSASEEH